jgi:hypothetical protein
MPRNKKNINLENGLIDHLPDAMVWSNIEKALDFESSLTDRLPHLPVYEPDAEVWNKISRQLPSRKSFSINFRYWTVAASVAVMLVTTLLVLQSDFGKSDRQQVFTHNTLTENDMEQAALTEIKKHCSLHMPVCEQSNFQELMQLYEELTSDEMALKSAMKQLGDSPEMIQALVKIENMKSATIRDLIQLIQS